MPQAILHILVPLTLAALFKDIYERNHGRGTFPLHYVLIAGIAGIIPDLDVAVFFIVHLLFGLDFDAIHRTGAHTLFVPLAFCGLAIIFRKSHVKFLRTHHLKVPIVFYLLAFGSLIHMILDSIFGGTIMPLYPLSHFAIGFNLVGRLPEQIGRVFVPSLEAGLFVLWLIWLEVKHKVSDFI